MGKFDRTSGPAAQTRSPQKNGGGTLLGIFIGLVLGVLIAFGVVWYLNQAKLPFQNKFEGAPRVDKDKPANGAQTPAPLPGKPGDKPSERQRFEFYGILEGKQPPPAATGTPPAGAPAVAVTPGAEPKPAPSEIFFLQVGSFQKAADADNLKAKLALTGLDASVQEVVIPDKGTMHRVRIGPFRDPEEMNRARAVLAQGGVQGSVVKQKE
jgi:cell division protein FtsN